MTNVSVKDNALPDIGDHFPVHFFLPVAKPTRQERVITYRKYKQINMDTFQADIQGSILSQTPAPDIPITEVVEQYNTVLAELLDKHAPAKTRRLVRQDIHM